MRLVYRFIAVSAMFFISITSLYAQNKTSPNDISHYVERVSRQFNDGHWEKGKAILDTGLRKNTKDADLKMLLGKYFFEKKEYDTARYTLNKALEIDPGNVGAKQILINVEMLTKRYSSAICFVNELLEINPYWKGLWRKKIELYTLQRNYVEANRLRKRILQIYPNDTALQSAYIYNTELQANKLRKAGKIDEAINLSKDIVHHAPNDAENYQILANDYLKAGDQYSALTYINRGLRQFPGNISLINKKTGILAEQKRYGELLDFLRQQMKYNDLGILHQQYDYYQLQAARDAKDKDPAVLYGKILLQNPRNEEAFSYAFNDAVNNQQYEMALNLLKRYREVRGNSKELSLKELLLYKKMGNTSRANSLTISLFHQYLGDMDLSYDYAKIMQEQAKDQMASEQYVKAILSWRQVRSYGDEEMEKVAQNAIFNAYIAEGDYLNALNTLDIIIDGSPNDPELYVKRAVAYQKLQRYSQAVSAYEKAIELADKDEESKYLGGYADMLTVIIKDLNDHYRYEVAMNYIKEWLQHDPDNQLALQYAVDQSYKIKDMDQVRQYAVRGNDAYPNDVFFKIKLAQINSLDPEAYPGTVRSLSNELLTDPYNKELINTLSQFSENYGTQLIKNKRNKRAISVLDSALVFDPDNNSLKYQKGIAYERLHQYDSAYYYQQFYKPSLMEINEYKQHLNYLGSKSYKNEVGIHHLRSRPGDHFATSTVSTFEYTRFEDKNTYTGRMNYAGRKDGKGIQVLGEWNREWSDRTRTKFNAGLASKFFPSLTLDASLFRYFDNLGNVDAFKNIEGEVELGYRRLYEGENLINLGLGATKLIDPWRLNAKLQVYMLDDLFLYNVSTDLRYYIASPRTYVMAVGSIGSSPDIQLIDYQFYDGFSVLNTMVGAGGGYLLSKTTSVSLLGTWYNYYNSEDDDFPNLYNIYLSLNVRF